MGASEHCHCSSCEGYREGYADGLEELEELKRQLAEERAKTEAAVQYVFEGPGGRWYVDRGAHTNQWWVEQTTGQGEHLRFEDLGLALAEARRLAGLDAPAKEG